MTAGSSPPSILVIGGTGQVARALGSLSTLDLPILTLGRADGVDLSAPETLREALGAHRPRLVVNAAAYTAVDRAESEPDIAFSVNAEGAGRLAVLAAERGLPVIHISTDYVFDGQKPSPYDEDDPVAPLGVYGRSKAVGETLIREAAGRHVILRTSWVYSATGSNFVRTMLRLSAIRDEIRVVGDQVGNPTSAGEIAKAIRRIALELLEGRGLNGTFHLVGCGSTSWHGFAKEIFSIAGRFGHRVPRLIRIDSVDFPTAATRPSNSRLNTTRLENAYGIYLPAWQDSLVSVVRDMLVRRTEGA